MDIIELNKTSSLFLDYKLGTRKKKTLRLDSNSRTLVDHHNSFLVRHVHDFISIWVVTCPKTISTKPLKQTEVLGY